MTDNIKPPLGVMPKRIWDLYRLKDLEGAICRYVENHKCIPNEWIEEYHQILKEHVDDRNNDNRTGYMDNKISARNV